ncbi:phage tail tape measure protein [Rhodoferax aquaticus]|uniref:Phage tail tape measure protein n=1 Tax=Rhodoferax aquaticus TaxID=2527691 RepID=A0A515ETD1_9BURK|nr:phage tail tape measure protein [Rhodoferax aquaticus]QDL55937.1 phage tail tape measure protein [Rhodoferax aquaticus]
MREMKLKYFIDLVSNIREKAGSDAQALVQAQEKIQKELGKTELKFGAYEKALMRIGGVHNASLARQSQYFSQIALSAARARESVEKYGRALQAAAPWAAGAAGATMALAHPAKEAMSYDRLMANMANTAFSDRDAAGRVQGMKTLEAAINRARKHGGGTREQAAGALDKILASGTVSDADAMAMLPGIMKASTASGASASELADIGIRAKQNFKIKTEDLPSVLSAAMAAGQAGGFELKDMSKWLPQQMAMAGNLGLSGKAGLAKLMAWNQASVITAGTKDEAGNNLKDLLNELNTGHFTGFMAEQYMNGGHHLKRGEKESKLKSVNDVYLDYQSRGVDKVSATMDMMDKIMSKNEGYQALQKKLQALNPDDKAGRKDTIEAMAAQMQGTAVGKLFHNQQSLGAFLGLVNNRQYTGDVLDKASAQYGRGAGQMETDTSYGVISGTSDFKLEQAGEDKRLAEKAAMDSLTPAIGKAADAFGGLASDFPKLTGSAMLAATALGAAALAAGGFSLATGGGLAGKVGGWIGGAAGRLGALFGGVSAGGLGIAAGGLGVAGAGAVGYGAGTLLYDHALEGTTFANGLGRGMARVGAFFGSKDAANSLAAEDAFEKMNSRPLARMSAVNISAPRAGTDFLAGATGLGSGRLDVGQGTLGIDLRVTDERVTAATRVLQQPSLIRINPGATNPGSLR